MSLRSFFLWFWGIVLASFTAGGATLAMFHGRAVAPPAPPIQQVAMTEPLPVPPVPATEEAPGERAAPAWRHPHIISARPSHAGGEPRHATEFARVARVTVVPPVPPARAAQLTESVTHASRLPALRPPERTETRTTTTWTTPAPAAEPRPRVYPYAPRYTRYSYYTYSYRPYYSYPYSYYYSYAY